ncbi:MAG TPA: bifunctional diguanylate cyclase/phosphodiesterase [Steroidobacteraceae bacterium]|nr:bifunctional diguanylate cyclase/phosphodiesterase [Steroidobacteraceae bacterium]
MRPAGLKRSPSWMPAAAVAAVVVLAGTRLITLSVRDHAAELRSTAQGAVSHHAHLIEGQLQALLGRARGESRRAAGTGDHRAPSAPPLTAVPGRNAFWMAGTGVLLRTGDADPAISRALAGEWVSAQAGGRTAAGLFGPVRYGSQWFVAAQAPVELPAASSATAGARAFAYEALDGLLLRAGFERLVREGYDFELFQDAENSRVARMFLRSRAAALDEPVTGAIHGPGAASLPSPAYLELAIRPHAGWYPIAPLAADVAVLALVTWALAFGAYDLAYSVRHARRALATARGRLRAVNARLAAEIEQHDALQKNLEHARYHDPSTGLPNRRYFMSQLDRALRDLHARRRRRLGIILIEIDRFALINDTLGHTAGDDLLLQAAQRFAKVLEGTEHSLARWGGDQCVALLYDVDSPVDVRAIAAALHAARQEPFALRRHRVRVATRMGFTCIERGLRRPEEALREADVALSVARRPSGPHTVEYTADLGNAAVSLVNLEADLHLALERGEFGLLFQPIFDLRAMRAVGVEALLRWYHPVEGKLTPERFLSIAEETGAIVPVTRWVIRQVCRLIADWRQSLPRDADFYISVNLSAAALRDPGLWEHVASVLEATRVPPGYLKFELAERDLIESVSAARPVLAAFRNMGIALMLDDFGTGYSSLSYLQLLPFDYVKIDRPFANRTGSERANNAITAAVLQMTSSLGLRAVAEVVETEAVARSLAQLGCNFGQGYYLSAPLEAADAFELLRRSPTPSTVVSTVPAGAEAPRTVRAADDTMILEDRSTVVLPDTPTLVLEAAIGSEIAVAEEAGNESRR